MRTGPEAAEWVKGFEGRYQNITASLNSLLKEREAQHISDASAKAIRHKVEMLEQSLGLLLSPKPQRRRGPAPGSKQSSAPANCEDERSEDEL